MFKKKYTELEQFYLVIYTQINMHFGILLLIKQNQDYNFWFIIIILGKPTNICVYIIYISYGFTDCYRSVCGWNLTVAGILLNMLTQPLQSSVAHKSVNLCNKLLFGIFTFSLFRLVMFWIVSMLHPFKLLGDTLAIARRATGRVWHTKRIGFSP